VGGLWAVAVLVEIAFFWGQGRWFERWSAHGWLLIVAGVTVARFAATTAGAWWPALLVLAQLTHAVTFAAHHAACVSLVSRYFPGRLRGRGQALYTTLGYGLSGVIGGVAGAWLIEAWGYASLFLSASLCAFLAFACAWRARLADQHARAAA
jgi:PPP family 3-phenylpropionic acid transporter